MELDLVDPVAVAVMGSQDRGVGVGLDAPALGLRGPGQRPERGQARDGAFPVVPPDCLAQRLVGGEEVVVDERGWLVRDLMGSSLHVAYRRTVAAGIARDETAGTAARPRTRTVLWQLTSDTVATCFRYRVTGLAAEAGFFALLSLPPLVLGLVGSIGYLGNWLGEDTVAEVQERIIDVAGRVLTADSVRDVIEPTLRDVFEGGRFDIISIGFLIALWSGSRALNVFIDTISIMYGLGGRRGIIRSRILSFSLYIVALLIGIIVVPLVLVGPTLLADLLPVEVNFLNLLYWPVATLLSVASLTSLYHISVPVRTPWRRDLPGAVLTMLIWYLGSFVIRWIISASVGGASIYGPLAAPIVLMIWLYVLAIAMLIGAALNAAVETRWPCREMLEAKKGIRRGRHPTRRRQPAARTGRRAKIRSPRRASRASLAPPSRPRLDRGPRTTRREDPMPVLSFACLLPGARR